MYEAFIFECPQFCAKDAVVDQRILRYRRSQCGVGNDVYRRKKDIEEFNEMYGPFCWQGYDNDPGGFKKLMWYGIMKHFNCKATSTWSKCGLAKETAFTHRQHGDRMQEWKSQLD